MGVAGQRHAPAALPRGKTRYPLYRKMGGTQGRCWRVWKISPPTGIRSAASRYTIWALPVHFLLGVHTIRCCHHFHLASTQVSLLRIALLCRLVSPLCSTVWKKLRPTNYTATFFKWIRDVWHCSARLLPACLFTVALTTVNYPMVAPRIFFFGGRGGEGEGEVCWHWDYI